MKLIWALFAAVAVIVSQAHAGRIVGGNPTAIESYPSIVQLEFGYWGIWTQECAGVVVNARYILSAAQCFLFTPANQRRIRAGSSNRHSGGILAYINWYSNHPSYGIGAGADANIAVAQLASTLIFSAAIQPIAIPVQGFELPDNAPVVYAGWGTTISGVESASVVLRDVSVFSINRSLCRERHESVSPGSNAVTDNTICSGLLDVGGADACLGDSGGPLYFGGVLVGVVSRGRYCADSFLPSVSVRVSAYTNWILTTAV